MANSERFYNYFQPSHYDLFFQIDRDQKLITGRTTITGQAQQTLIKLHQKQLIISSVTMAEKKLAFTLQDGWVEISLPQTGSITITLEYTAPLTDKLSGIYPSYYQDQGVTKQIIGTQFESNAAQQAFPCVDEPEAKATFDLALQFDEHPGETVLSNMPETSCVNGVHYFQRTLRMSTYLLAFGFGELQSRKTKTKSGVQVGVFATKVHQAKELDFALEMAQKSIEFYEDFYQTPYPLPHCWQLALPDFSAGAMENWGLITYREIYLLSEPQNIPLRRQQSIATVIAHEVAHQWFGDLVTMKWWDDLWLNESFANMMEYVAVDAIKPELKIWELFQTLEVPMALERDATAGVQAVHVPVDDPDRIDSLFDSAIVYAKGSRMLVMVRSLIGDANLRTGLKNYFAAHQYHNATGSDLWQALGEASGQDIGTIMQSWLQQPGYPVVHARIKNGDLVLEQEQFFTGTNQTSDRQWQIPLQSNYLDLPQIMTTSTLNLGNYETLRAQNKRPFQLNVGNNSHFIIDYDKTLLADLLQDSSQLNDLAQLQLLQDLNLLATGRYISTAEVIPLLQQFATSSANLVLEPLLRIAKGLQKFVEPQSLAVKVLHQFWQQLTQTPVQRLGWQAQVAEDHNDELARPGEISLLLAAKDPAALEKAHQLFQAQQDQPQKLPTTLRAAILTSEIRNFEQEAVFQQLLTDYQETTDTSYKADLARALAATPTEKHLDQLITSLTQAQVIKPQDLFTWCYQLLANPAASAKMWAWLAENWPWLQDTFGEDIAFSSCVSAFADSCRTPEQAAQFQAFFEPKLTIPVLTQEIQLGFQAINSRVELIQADQAAVQSALAQAVK
ncbi:M1 family metallopeptidase [Lactobacillus sp. DCY120]|uniref:Aminopeptidase n=1 Tax=Bombilactobacillus apium TaxID=2675299 RepID=A0A850RB97_9LACO|nr:M1 family metallopeptidase [Bombilactobacillus apium]NVY96078.1 M1 family metallopeptidase [Bombilactobacillus apium]